MLATLVSAVMDPLSPGLPQSPPSGWAQPAIAVDGADHDTGDGAWEGAVEVSTRSEPAPAGLSATVERVASEVVRPAAAGSGGALTIRLPDPRGVSSVAVSCPSGFTGRSTYGSTVHVIEGVPGEPCTLWFRGSSPYRFVGVAGGQSLTCSFKDSVIDCR